MNATYHAILLELIPFLRTAAAANPEATPADIRTVALVEFKQSDSPQAKQHIGERSKLLEFVDQLAACALSGKTYAESFPGTAKPAVGEVSSKAFGPKLEELEAALAVKGKPARRKAGGKTGG